MKAGIRIHLAGRDIIEPFRGLAVTLRAFRPQMPGPRTNVPPLEKLKIPRSVRYIGVKVTLFPEIFRIVDIRGLHDTEKKRCAIG